MTPSRHRRAASAGFTLIEILIVVSLLSITAVAITSSLIQSVKIFSRFNEVLDEEEKMIFAQRLTRDLKNSNPFLSVPWRVSESSLYFPSVTVGASEDGGFGGLPSRVSYQFIPEKHAVLRVESRFPYQKDNEDARVIATGVRSLRFDVLRDNEESSPQRVTVSMEYGSSVPPKLLKKIILIPSGYKEKSVV